MTKDTKELLQKIREMWRPYEARCNDKYTADEVNAKLRALAEYCAEAVDYFTRTPATIQPGDEAYMINFEDAEVRNEYFGGYGAKDGAFKRYEAIGDSWNASLYQRIATNWKEPFRATLTPSSVNESEVVEPDIDVWIDQHLSFASNLGHGFVMKHADVYELVRKVKASALRTLPPVVETAPDDVVELLDEALGMLQRVEDKQMGIWQREDVGYPNGRYVTWNDGEYWVSKATKMVRKALATVTQTSTKGE